LEEKFLEGFIKFERFYKKNRSAIIGTVAVCLVLIIGISVKNYIDTTTKRKANEAFNIILKNPSDTTALNILKDTSQNLYSIALFLKSKKDGKLQEITLPLLKELSQYSIAIQDGNIDKLNSVIVKNDFVLREYSLFNKALLQTKKSDFVAAKETLKLISKDSQTAHVSNLLQHFLITK